MKVVVISASPRKGANTQIMMEYLYNYVKTKNADTKFIDLSKDRIDDPSWHQIHEMIVSNLDYA